MPCKAVNNKKQNKEKMSCGTSNLTHSVILNNSLIITVPFHIFQSEVELAVNARPRPMAALLACQRPHAVKKTRGEGGGDNQCIAITII